MRSEENEVCMSIIGVAWFRTPIEVVVVRRVATMTNASTMISDSGTHDEEARREEEDNGDEDDGDGWNAGNEDG